VRFGPDGPDLVTARTPGETPPWRPPPATVPIQGRLVSLIRKY
jgi:hypothetical protein